MCLGQLVELARPVLVPVSNIPSRTKTGQGGEAFWLTGNTIAHALDIYAIDVVPLLGSFPTSSATNFRYSTDGFLVFSDSVYADGNLTTVKEQDEAWENRGTSALVMTTLMNGIGNHWFCPNHRLCLVSANTGPDHKWTFGSEFVNLLAGTSHSSPVEPFGGTDDFDVSKKTVIYTTLDPLLSPAWHTKQNVYIALKGQTHSPILNENADKEAWLELDKDGAKIVIYDLKKDKWAAPPICYFSHFRGDHAKVKYLIPVPIVEDGASSVLIRNRHSRHQRATCFSSEVWMICRCRLRRLKERRNLLEREQITNLTDLKEKKPEASRRDIDVQGWILKLRGWKEGEKRASWLSPWEDQWSTRWNRTSINPTGSSTFGQGTLLPTQLAGLGGKPFVDLQKGWKHVLDTYGGTYISIQTGCCWLSYWIQGHPEYNFGFKALFCHDGVRSKLFFVFHKCLLTTGWEKERKNWQKSPYNPSNFVDKWNNRLPETEGIEISCSSTVRSVYPSRLVIFPDENHWVLKHGNRWFNEFVGEKN
ncbi:hypothetical protein BT96DRAFT_927683 [Gymnopus androsaceus JB14]|uniref:Uncharacterized protein n=1 Tax=Gymnopus androsaceus JB14 TaxID=1447944 RepID=A0A6A4GNE5_9AGAR|nr:hypothetical protein BT96DRAFT_927683 [Gymnopus androsaceus JB14]